MPRITGRYERTRVGGEEVAAFIPEPLPPHDPPLSLDGEVAALLVRAEAALGGLAARLSELLPENPIVTIGRVVDLLSTTKPTANKAVSALFDAGVLVETTGRRRVRTCGRAACRDRPRSGTEI